MRDALLTLLDTDYSAIADVSVSLAENKKASNYQIIISDEILQTNQNIGMYKRNYRIRVYIIGKSYTVLKQIFDKIQSILTANSIEWGITYSGASNHQIICTVSKDTLEAIS